MASSAIHLLLLRSRHTRPHISLSHKGVAITGVPTAISISCTIKSCCSSRLQVETSRQPFLAFVRSRPRTISARNCRCLRPRCHPTILHDFFCNIVIKQCCFNTLFLNTYRGTEKRSGTNMPALHTFSAKKHEILADCETKLGYTFVDKQHCFAALNATGFRLRWSTDTPPATKNDRLAILGDIMLDTNLARKWFNNTTYDKGRHEKIRAKSKH